MSRLAVKIEAICLHHAGEDILPLFHDIDALVVEHGDVAVRRALVTLLHTHQSRERFRRTTA